MSAMSSLAAPTAAAQLAVLQALAGELTIAGSESAFVERALALLADLLPGRALCVRVLDVRSSMAARPYAHGASLRDGVAREGVAITQAALVRARLKGAVAASARLLVRDRWDSPFTGIATGFAVPLAAAGELYGLLDVGYPPGMDSRATDEPAVHAITPYVALALRTLRLSDDALGLRDYQARLLESANALILCIDRAWRITVCNRALLELSGFLRDEVIGRDVRDFISIDQRQYLTSALASALTGQHHAAVTVGLPRRDGSQVRTVWSFAPVGRANAADAIEAVVAIGQDQSQIEALQQQIVRAERLATLGEIAAGVVHELNNPLTSITVYADYLTRKLAGAGVDPADLEKLRRIGASAQRILRFSRDLVQYARPSGQDLEPVDVATAVRQSVSICEHLVERGGIALAVQIDSELPMIHAIAGQLEQVVINLVTNAIHAVEPGGRVRVRAWVESPSTIALEVADSGPGVAPGDRDRIFEPFFTTKSDGKGTGLGLSIVRNIVDQHRGEIRVDRADLGGAAFRIILPAV
jgi:PAS domain S-box-containing protein